MKNEFLEGLEEKLEKDHKELEERTQEILRQIVSVRKISVAIPGRYYIKRRFLT
jgi:hypothetical protein